MLSLFADLADSATERKIRGVRSVDSRPVVRRVRAADRHRRGARPRDHRHARREGLRGQRRVPARRDPRPLLRRIRRAQSLHPDGDPHGRARRDHALAAAGPARGGRCERPTTRARGGALALRLLRGAAAARAQLPGPAAHRRQRRAARGISSRSARTRIMDFPASNLSRGRARPAGAAARCSSNSSACSGRRARCRSRRPRRAYRWLLDARRRVPALPRHPQPPLPAAVLPRLGGCAAGRAARPAGGATASSPMSAR